MSIPAIVINLDRSPDRLVHIKAEFARAGMFFERFRGVDGRKLPDGAKPYFCDAAGRLVSPLTAGEIGCYASHLAIWQRIAAGGYGPAALVCEDDIELSDDLAGLLEAIPRAVPSGWDIVRLVDNDKLAERKALPLAPLPGARALIRYWHLPMLAGGYLLSTAGARKLLRAGIRTHGVDADLRRPWIFGLDHYGVHPAPIEQQHVLASIIGRERGCALATMPGRPSRLTPLRGLEFREYLYNLRKMGLQCWLRLRLTSRAAP
jgi:glycosyl transferase, family 25